MTILINYVNIRSLLSNPAIFAITQLIFVQGLPMLEVTLMERKLFAFAFLLLSTGNFSFVLPYQMPKYTENQNICL